MDVAAHGAEDHFAQFLGDAGLGGQEGFEGLADLTQHLAAHDEFREEVGAFLIASTYHLHGFRGEIQDLVGVFAFGEQVVDDLKGFFFLHVRHGFYEFVGHRGSLKEEITSGEHHQILRPPYGCPLSASGEATTVTATVTIPLTIQVAAMKHKRLV